MLGSSSNSQGALFVLGLSANAHSEAVVVVWGFTLNRGTLCWRFITSTAHLLLSSLSASLFFTGAGKRQLHPQKGHPERERESEWEREQGGWGGRERRKRARDRYRMGENHRERERERGRERVG